MIEASRCPACGRVDVPPEPACPGCRADTDAHGIGPEGRVLASTRLPGQRPVALVELDGGARVLARASEEGVTIGDRVRVTHDPDGSPPRCSRTHA